MIKKNWFLLMLGFVLGFLVLIMLFFGVGWIRLNRINGKAFISGQPYFYTVLDEKYVTRLAGENIIGVSDSIGIDPSLVNNVFSGVVSNHKVDDEFVLVGKGMKIKLRYSQDSEISYFSRNQSSLIISKDRLVLTKGLVNGNMVLVLFDENYFVTRFVFSDDYF